jgi:hypothetical protein
MSIKHLVNAGSKYWLDAKVDDLEVSGNQKYTGSPIFLMRLSGNQNLSTASTFTTLQFNTSDINLSTVFNTSTYTFTAPVTGVYEFAFNLQFSGINSDMALSEIQIVAGGSNYLPFRADMGGMLGTGNFYSVCGVMQIKLTATQTALIQAKSSGTLSGPWQLDASGSYFSGKLITKT